MPQACWPQSIPFTEAELNNNYRIAKRRKVGGEGARQRSCLRALLGPRKTLLQLSELVDVADNGTFFSTGFCGSALGKKVK